MSKPVKNLLIRDYSDRLEGVENALVLSVRGMPAKDNNRLRMGLAQKNIKVVVVRNALARNAFKGTALEGLGAVLEGPSALAFGGESVIDVARELVKWAKDVQNLELKGAILDGDLFEGAEGVNRLSKYPTREEAIAQDITLILSPGRNLMGAVKGPGGRVMGIVKTIESKLEKGETIGASA